MQLVYGSYAFTANAAGITTRRELLRNAGGQLYAQKISWDVEGYLYADGQSAISAAMAELSVALQTPFLNLGLKHDDGSLSAALLTNNGSTTGVRIETGPDFDRNNGSEFSLERHFRFTASAEYPLPGSLNLLLDFHESVTFSGGGPRYVLRENLDTPPQKQMTHRFTVYKATQSGFAVGYLRYPNRMPPIWPNDLVESNPESTPESPRRMGLKYQEFKTTWKYTFAAARPLIGLPNIWKA